jgi:hypothetical protein
MNGERVVVRGVSWRDLVPWLILFRTFRVAKSLPVLLLATVGALLSPAGWYVGGQLFVDPSADVDPAFQLELEGNQMLPGRVGAVPVPHGGVPPATIWQMLEPATDTLHPIFWKFVRPVQRLLSGELPLTTAAYYAFGSLWMLAVWGLLGGAITRIAAMRLGREEDAGFRASLRHARQRWGSYFVAPLFPLLGVLLVALPMLLVGFLMRFDAGVLAAGIGWMLILLGGLLIAILLLGLLFGWPLMWVAISSERNGDAFEAFSRSYSYTFQRPLHYLFYAAVSVVFGGLAWLLVYHFTEAVIRFAEWPVQLAAGHDRWNELQGLISDPGPEGTILALGTRLIAGFNGLARSVAAGFAYSFFWCLATAIYLLLRRDVDHTEFDEVFVEDEIPPERDPEKSPPGGADELDAPTDESDMAADKSD